MPGENESYDYRQGYAKGYHVGFWAGGIAGIVGSLGLFYLIGTLHP